MRGCKVRCLRNMSGFLWLEVFWSLLHKMFQTRVLSPQGNAGKGLLLFWLLCDVDGVNKHVTLRISDHVDGSKYCCFVGETCSCKTRLSSACVCIFLLGGRTFSSHSDFSVIRLFRFVGCDVILLDWTWFSCKLFLQRNKQRCKCWKFESCGHWEILIIPWKLDSRWKMQVCRFKLDLEMIPC